MKSKMERKLTEVFEDRVLRKILEPKKMVFNWIKLLNDKLYGLYFSSDVIEVTEYVQNEMDM
jgi:hypothetical protein